VFHQNKGFADESPVRFSVEVKEVKLKELRIENKIGKIMRLCEASAKPEAIHERLMELRELDCIAETNLVYESETLSGMFLFHEVFAPGVLSFVLKNKKSFDDTLTGGGNVDYLQQAGWEWFRKYALRAIQSARYETGDLTVTFVDLLNHEKFRAEDPKYRLRWRFTADEEHWIFQVARDLDANPQLLS